MRLDVSLEVSMSKYSSHVERMLSGAIIELSLAGLVIFNLECLLPCDWELKIWEITIRVETKGR